ncbi:MAG TPA: sugar ABC transporter permease [Chloroflexota bacterium]|nr:sugar ABC transporter permease [Chloroflexota bacterium]
MSKISPTTRNQAIGRGLAVRRFVRRNTTGYLFILPLVAFLLLYQLYPILRVLWLSFTNFRNLYPDGTAFVGLRNYSRALQDPIFWQGIGQAAEFTAIFIPGGVLFPVLLAILLDRVRNPKVAGVYRTLLYIPALIPGPLVFILWNWIYGPTQGLLNLILIGGLHLGSWNNPPTWLGNDAWVIPCIAFMEWWWGLGYHTIFFMVGLSGISNDLYEAARIDGASERQIAWRISLPLLKPMLLIILILRLSTAMGVLVEYLIMGHDPFHPWTVYMYNLAFQNAMPMGHAAAIGWLGAIIMLAFALVLYYFLRPDPETR